MIHFYKNNMKYTELLKKQSQEFEKIPKFFAFSQKQLEEWKEKLGVKDNKELLSIGHGWFIKKTDWNAYENKMEEMDKEKIEFLSVRENLIDSLVYELGNHEHCITWRYSDALEALGLELDTLTDFQKECLKEAKKIYINNWE